MRPYICIAEFAKGLVHLIAGRGAASLSPAHADDMSDSTGNKIVIDVTFGDDEVAGEVE